MLPFLQVSTIDLLAFAGGSHSNCEGLAGRTGWLMPLLDCRRNKIEGLIGDFRMQVLSAYTKLAQDRAS